MLRNIIKVEIESTVERDNLTSCSQVMVELWMRKREMGNGNGDDMGWLWEDMGNKGYDLPGRVIYLLDPKMDCLPLPACLSSFISQHTLLCFTLSIPPRLRVNPCIESQLPSRFPPDRLPPDRPPPDRPLPCSLDHGLRVHLYVRSIAISKCS